MKKVIKYTLGIVIVLGVFSIFSYQTAKRQIDSSNPQALIQLKKDKVAAETKEEDKYLHPFVYLLGFVICLPFAVMLYNQLDPTKGLKNKSEDEYE